MCSAFFQCISPGLVETGFAFKLHDNDPERAAATYESIRVGSGKWEQREVALVIIKHFSWLMVPGSAQCSPISALKPQIFHWYLHTV